MHASTVLCELLASCIDVLLLAARHRDAGPLARKGLGDAEVDAGGAAEHENMAVLEIEIDLHWRMRG